VEREIGRLLGKNTRAARLFDVKVTTTEDGGARIDWSKIEGRINSGSGELVDWLSKDRAQSRSGCSANGAGSPGMSTAISSD
jgi:hypothetical protein